MSPKYFSYFDYSFNESYKAIEKIDNLRKAK